MLQHERIYLSEGIDTNKTGASKEYMLCHYWYFKDIGYNKCHHVLRLLMNYKIIAILNVKGIDYRCFYGY